MNEYNNPSFATMFQRALLNTCITTCFGLNSNIVANEGLLYSFIVTCATECTQQTTKQTNSMVWVRERTILTERPPLVGEVIANFLRIKGATWSAWRKQDALTHNRKKFLMNIFFTRLYKSCTDSQLCCGHSVQCSAWQDTATGVTSHNLSLPVQAGLEASAYLQVCWAVLVSWNNGENCINLQPAMYMSTNCVWCVDYLYIQKCNGQFVRDLQSPKVMHRFRCNFDTKLQANTRMFRCNCFIYIYIYIYRLYI
jgi:hypothetical protein